ncbi:MAG: ribonuclease HI [Bacillota bacterium]|nr:ribonuclease HI [Bacillota bacterium]
MIIYTDGSANPNPGPGGYGIVILDNNENLLYTISRHFNHTTNNEMELKAILTAFILYGTKNKKEISTIYTDSEYSRKTFTEWMFTWAKNDWLNSKKKTPENIGIITDFYWIWEAGYRINIERVPGHSNHKWNDLADSLAGGKEKTYIDKNFNNLLENRIKILEKEGLL